MVSVSGKRAARCFIILCLLGFSVAAVLPAFKAYADDSTFLLQLGSSSSEADATQKWNDIKAKNKDIVGNLNLHVAEVATTPDNTITYRTQAGPIVSHDQAATLCSTLQSRGVECYVVETALFTPSASSSTPPVAATEAPPVTATDSAPSTVSPTPATAVEAPAPEKPGFFGRLFGSSAPAAPPPAPAAIAAPATQAVPDTALVVAAPVATPAPAPVPPPEPAALAPAPAAHPSLPFGVLGQLPPEPAAPPAPEAAVATAAPPPAPAPAPAAPPKQPFGVLGQLPAEPASQQVPPAPGVVGNVKVAEAIRVPLSSNKPRKNYVPNLPAVHGLGGLPSQSSAKTFWAQLSFFADETQARNFYQEFRAAYPQFSNGVRIRITKPYGMSDAGHVSLRVGPFAGTDDIRTICKAATNRGLICGIVRDVGTSITANIPRSHTAYHTAENSAYNHDESSVASSQYWVQLGSFRSADEAYDSWKSLQDDNKKLLRHVHSTVTSPPMSSAARPLYRLRAGPFVSQMSANNLCQALQGQGSSCIVVNDQ